MMTFLAQFGWIFATWKWGDWRHWQKYQPTMLYVVSVALLYEFLTFNYPIWVYSDFWLPSHTLNALIVTLIGIPLSALIFLSHFPEHSIRKQIIHVLWWVLLYAAIELTWVIIGLFHYYHGWTYWWSVFFDCIMFPMVRLHYKRPLLAFGMSVPIIIAFMVIFRVPILK